MRLLRSLSLVLLMVAATALPAAKAQDNKVDPTWESLNQRGYPAWFRDAKLGIFIHWGLYSVPAYASPEGYGEWYYRGLMSGDTGRIAAMRQLIHDQGLPADSLTASNLYGYGQLRNLWHAELWQPNAWATLFRQAGAQYVLLVTKHHDGYCLWDYDNTAIPQWNSVVSGPRRNIVKELSEAVRRQGMKMGFYYSLNEWTNPLHTWTIDPNDSIARYVDDYMTPQFKDLVSRYHPSLIFTDGQWDNTAEQYHARDLISWYYNTEGPEAIVNDRWGHGTRHGFLTPEYSSGILDTVRPWAECRGVGRSFGVNRNERIENFVSGKELIHHFVQLVAGGGGLTLNVGPNADGTIPFIQQDRLLALGKWLEVNGEAIYGSRPWTRPCDMAPYTMERLDSTLVFNWVRNAPHRSLTVDSFGATWHFTVEPAYSEDYTFRVAADDSAALYLLPRKGNPMLLCTSRRDTAVATLHMQAGQSYDMELRYGEQDLEARVSLLWSSPSQQIEPVRAPRGFHAVYSCSKPTVCYTTKCNDLYAIVLEWPHKVDGEDYAVAIATSHRPDKDMKVTLLGCDKPLRWKYSQGRILIAVDNLDYNDLSNPGSAWTFKLENMLRP